MHRGALVMDTDEAHLLSHVGAAAALTTVG